MVEAIKISKSFGKRTIFSNLDFYIKKGEIKAITGLSGKGKTTLLKVLCGLLKVEEGTIKIGGKFLVQDGKYVNKQEQVEVLKAVGIVFQNFNLFLNLNVFNNLKIVNNDVSRAESLLKRFGLFEKRQDFVNSLSGGQQQRLAIVRSLLLGPEVIFFDEPTSALDSRNSEEVLKMIFELKEEGYTIVVVTHDLNFVEKLGCEVFEI